MKKNYIAPRVLTVDMENENDCLLSMSNGDASAQDALVKRRRGDRVFDEEDDYDFE